MHEAVQCTEPSFLLHSCVSSLCPSCPLVSPERFAYVNSFKLGKMGEKDDSGMTQG